MTTLTLLLNMSAKFSTNQFVIFNSLLNKYFGYVLEKKIFINGTFMMNNAEYRSRMIIFHIFKILKFSHSQVNMDTKKADIEFLLHEYIVNNSPNNIITISIDRRDAHPWKAGTRAQVFFFWFHLLRNCSSKILFHFEFTNIFIWFFNWVFNKNYSY